MRKTVQIESSAKRKASRSVTIDGTLALPHLVVWVCSPSTVMIANGSGRRNTSLCSEWVQRMKRRNKPDEYQVEGSKRGRAEQGLGSVGREKEQTESHLWQTICSYDCDSDLSVSGIARGLKVEERERRERDEEVEIENWLDDCSVAEWDRMTHNAPGARVLTMIGRFYSDWFTCSWTWKLVLERKRERGE